MLLGSNMQSLCFLIKAMQTERNPQVLILITEEEQQAFVQERGGKAKWERINALKKPLFIRRLSDSSKNRS